MTRVAYVMSRFPKLTETFILAEFLAVRRQGIDVRVHPLLRERTDVVHPDAVPVVAEATFLPFLSASILRSNLREVRTRPARYLRTFAAVLRGTWGSLNFTVGALGIFPKVVHMASQLRDAGVDHVHCHFATHPAVAGFVVRRLTGIPFSFTAHGSDLHVDRHMLPQKVAEAAFVVAISEYNRQLILDECPGTDPEKVVVVHCGVDVSVFRPRTAPRAGGPFNVVCIGTLHEVKGQRHLIEACALAIGRGVDLRCVLVGDGEDRAALEARVAELGIGHAVSLAGALPRDEVLRIVADADVVVAPSVPTAQGKREGIPVVLMEAMACGLPVVASDLSGIPELVTDGADGVLVPPGDATALADALVLLAADAGLRERLGSEGRRTVVERFNVDRSAEQLAARFGGSGVPEVRRAS